MHHITSAWATVQTTITQTIASKLWTKTEEQVSNANQIQQVHHHGGEETKTLKMRTFKGLINHLPHITILLGRKGSGKTSLLIDLLRTPGGYFKKYKRIIIISPTYVSQHEKSWSKISREGVEVFSLLSDQLLTYIEQQSQSKEGLLVISDDQDEAWRKSVDHQIVNRMISNSRHSNLSFVFLSQSVVQLPTIIRRNCDVYVLFGACSYQEINLIYAEVSTVQRKDFWDLFSKATSKPYGFLVVSIERGKIRFYDSFNQEL